MKHARLLATGLSAMLALATRADAFTWPDAVDHVTRDLSSPDAGVRKVAAEKLQSLTPAVATPLLLRALEDPDVEVRIAAAHGAITRHMIAAGHAVLPWLGERDVRLRVVACEVLGQLPDPSGVAQLARALGDSEATVRAAAAVALGQQASPEATPPLLGKLDDASPAVRAEVVRALARLGDSRAVVPLVGKAQDSVPEVRHEVARALGELGDARATPALVLELRDASTDVRIAAVGALGQLRAEKAADAVAPLATDRNPLLRRAAVEALGRIGGPESVAALVGLLGTADDATAALESSPTREALASTGASAGPALRALLAGPSSPAAATGAAWVLGELHSSESIAEIVRALRRGSLPAAAALRALSSMASGDAIPIVLEFVDDPSPAVRHEALHAAEDLLDPARPDGRAVEPLVSALRDPLLSPPERAAVASLLGRTGAPRAAPTIEALLSTKDPELRLAAIDALGALGPTREAASLLAQLDSNDPAVRLRAAIAVGRAGGADARDALLARLEDDSDIDRAAVLIALGGVMARVPSDSAVATVSHALRLAPGSDRDSLILALARANVGAAVQPIRELLVSPNPDDRRTLATALAARGAVPATTEMLSALLMDPDAGVRAEAAWALGEVGGLASLAALRSALSAPDLAPAIDATAALGRIAARSKGAEAAIEELCHRLMDPRDYVRANAAAGLALSAARCGDGSSERRLLTDGLAAVRAAAARAITRHPLGPADVGALDRCRTADASGSVARLCGSRAAGSQIAGTEPVEIFVQSDVGVAPEPGAPYLVEFADGLLRAGRCDRRGSTFDPAAPRGEVTLLRSGYAR